MKFKVYRPAFIQDKQGQDVEIDLLEVGEIDVNDPDEVLPACESAGLIEQDESNCSVITEGRIEIGRTVHRTMLVVKAQVKFLRIRRPDLKDE
jgi:hypothetical protein